MKRLARSVLGLCDHYDVLSGVTVCLACDRVVADGDDSMPYDRGSASSGGAVARVHARCADAPRRCR